MYNVPIEKRFRAGYVIAPSGCWEWRRGKVRGGYGRCQHTANGNVEHYAHRIAWILHFGDIPSDMRVLHKCDNPPCVNPEHLFLGTDADNMADRDAKGRYVLPPHIAALKARTHCNQGHPYSEENTIRHQGKRHCRTCRTNYLADYRKRRKAA